MLRDGTCPDASFAADIVEADRRCGSTLHALACINPVPVKAERVDPTLIAGFGLVSSIRRNETHADDAALAKLDEDLSSEDQ